MRLLKPGWVSHGGKPIFSIDIHPDGTRFATGGQGDDCGKVVVWNMAPVKEQRDEKDEKVPKILCTLDNHLACVNCVRWSNNGKYLASAGDDKLIMIWQYSSYGGMSTVFGSSGKLVNVEQWRCVNTLRGHSGDVLDVAWSPHDAWLATCSIDNTVVIWNALKFPEQISVLRGHTGMVKGVTWDPVGKYLASQSDDRSLRVWRTLDWQQEAVVTEPFEECGGTTHVLRLSWSPDGHYVVSAHAMNNSGPTAQIIERDGWKASMDFVGHRKAITVVRFNPNILCKKFKKSSDRISQQYSCCAIGSRDRSLSVWLTALKRPLVVTHDLFSSSILDISWNQKGLELLCCSWDGTVAYVDFMAEEIGVPLTLEKKAELHRKTYGKSLTLSNINGNNQIIETTAMLKIQQQQQEKKKEDEKEKERRPVVNGNNTPLNGQFTNKQIETKTPDGRRRITPIFLAPQPDLGEVPQPFSSNSQPVFSGSKEQSSIVVEKKDSPSKGGSTTSSPAKSVDGGNKETQADDKDEEDEKRPTEKLDSPAASAALQDMHPMAALEARVTTKPKPPTPTPEKSYLKEKKNKKDVGAKRRLDTSDVEVKRRRKYKERERALSVSVPPQPPPTALVEKESRVVYTSSGLQLRALTMDKTASIQVSGSLDDPDNSIILDVTNSVQTTPIPLHKLRCVKGGEQAWEIVLASRVIAVTANKDIVCVACEDESLSLFSSSGRRLLPCISLGSGVAVLHSNSFHVMVVTCKGTLYVWNFGKMSATIENQSLVSIIPGNDVTIHKSQLTDEGLPLITLSTGCTYTFKKELACWLLLSSPTDVLHQCSDHQSCLPAQDAAVRHTGTLATLQQFAHRAGTHAARLYHNNPSIQQAATISHLEKQVTAAFSLRSGHEYKFWFLTYIRYLVQEGVEIKLREVCDDLLGPLYKSKSSTWSKFTLGLNKHSILLEVLPIIGSNLRLQRLFTEYKEQLDSVKA